jgi:hypothetical protein
MLLDAGHPFARQYPVGMMMDEAAIVDERHNAYLAMQGTLIQLAISSVPSEYNKPGVKMAKAAAKAFAERIKLLRGA